MSSSRICLRLVAKRDPTARQIVGRHGHGDSVPGENANAKLPHLSCDGCQKLVPVRDLHAEHGAGQDLGHDALELDRFFFHAASVSWDVAAAIPPGHKRNKGLLAMWQAPGIRNLSTRTASLSLDVI